LRDVDPPVPGHAWAQQAGAQGVLVAWSGFADLHSGLHHLMVYAGDAGGPGACPAVGGLWEPPTAAGAVLLPPLTSGPPPLVKVCAFDRTGHAVAVLAEVAD
jgi:hypothetical protein